MDDNEIKQMDKRVTEKYYSLPKDLQEAIAGINTAETIQAVSKKYGLNIEQAGQLAHEAGLLMFGETSPKDFINNLEKNLNTGRDTAQKIAEEINVQIFAKVRESLKKIHGVREDDKTFAAPAPTPPQQPAQTQTAKSPFEQKLEDKVFKPAERPLVKEVEEARKENRYPQAADPYIEPPK